jgi:alkylation response protein AidB-like acyl-CoA dehydrogenase
MNFQLTEEQAALIAAVQAILQDHLELPQSARLNSHYFDATLQQVLQENGFLDAGRELGPLEAALIVEEAAKIPAVTEVSASALVTPQLLPQERLAGPVALVSGRSLDGAHRNLAIARTALIDLGEDVAIVPIGPGDVVPVECILAYPFGRFARLPDVNCARKLAGAAHQLRQWWRVALAAEFAGAAQSAINVTLEHVKQRHAFGRPIGSFQVVQHRLVQCQIAATGVRWLALRAAWSGEPYHADLAACYAQQHVRKLLVDLHQFTGAMGVTNEFPLHLWTYRLRALQSEAGGLNEAAQAVARHRWSAGSATSGRAA